VALAFKTSTLLSFHRALVQRKYRLLFSPKQLMVRRCCRMFKQASRGASLPKYLSSDRDPLFRFHQWEANRRILGVDGTQNSSLRSVVPPARRTIDWDHPTRVFGPVVLDGNRFRKQTYWVQGRLKQI
jgi:hypothetical protein